MDYFDLFLKGDTTPQHISRLTKALFEVLKENFVFTAKDEETINSIESKLYMAHGTVGIVMDGIKMAMILRQMRYQLVD
ncbi:hypothetical protein [Gracilibacillus xinjiangensis]|uniref:Uncharacterized protein n=1 Tax=Gracilibacillus xinjiangensis TaxID=1193282 RepID=A0ABV8WTC7_9BACI